MGLPESLVTSLISSAAAIAGAALGATGTLWQLRHERWRAAGDVERSDAATLWSTQSELVRQLLTSQATLSERLDRLSDRLDRLGQQIVDMAARLTDAVERLDDVIASQRRTEEAVRRINGG